MCPMPSSKASGLRLSRLVQLLLLLLLLCVLLTPILYYSLRDTCCITDRRNVWWGSDRAER